MSDQAPSFSIAPVLTSVSFLLLSYFAYLISISGFDPAKKEAVRAAIAREFAISLKDPAQEIPAVPRVIDDLFAQKELGAAPQVHAIDGNGGLAIVFPRGDLFDEKSTVLRNPYPHLLSLLGAELASRSESVEVMFAVDPVQSPLNDGDEGTVAQLLAVLPVISKDLQGSGPQGKPDNSSENHPISGVIVSKLACEALHFPCDRSSPPEAVAIVLRKKGAPAKS